LRGVVPETASLRVNERSGDDRIQLTAVAEQCDAPMNANPLCDFPARKNYTLARYQSDRVSGILVWPFEDFDSKIWWADPAM
jgi:hypothetical protein